MSLIPPPPPARKPIFGSKANQEWRDRMSISELEDVWESLNKPYSKTTKKLLKNWKEYIDWRKSIIK